MNGIRPCWDLAGSCCWAPERALSSQVFYTQTGQKPKPVGSWIAAVGMPPQPCIRKAGHMLLS
jgi:hypothetical protein